MRRYVRKKMKLKDSSQLSVDEWIYGVNEVEIVVQIERMSQDSC